MSSDLGVVTGSKPFDILSWLKVTPTLPGARCSGESSLLARCIIIPATMAACGAVVSSMVSPMRSNALSPMIRALRRMASRTSRKSGDGLLSRLATVWTWTPDSRAIMALLSAVMLAMAILVSFSADRLTGERLRAWLPLLDCFSLGCPSSGMGHLYTFPLVGVKRRFLGRSSSPPRLYAITTLHKG